MKSIFSHIRSGIHFCAFIALVTFGFINNVSASCVQTTGTYSVSGTVSGCYDWYTGSITVNSGASITSSSASAFATTNTTLGNALGSFINNGSITAGSGYGVINNQPGGGTISSITNNGSMTNSGYAATTFIFDSTLTSFTNNGSITQTGAGNNNGAIEVAGSGYGGIGAITTLSNSSGGVITSSGGSAIGNIVGGSIGTLVNQGVISATGTGTWSGSWLGSAIYNNSYSSATTTIGTIENTGSIYSTVSGGFGIVNYGNIGTLSNSQGAGNTNGALTYTGALPTNYNATINSLTTYGQLATTNATGSTTWGITSGSTIAVGTSTYASVLSGLTSSNILNYNTTYFYGNTFGQTLALTPQGGSSTIWDITVTPTNNSNLSVVTSLNSPFDSSTAKPNVILDGGTYQIASSGSESNSLYITRNNGTIDQNGASVTFTNPIGDATSRAQGSLTVANSSAGGSVTLSAYNTYSGATSINSGATLALSGAGSIAQSSGVANSGTFDISATTSGATVQALSGSGAVALGSKNLSISNASGTFSGAVAGTGGLNITGGTQALSGANTYTGATTVSSGATLALSGSGAIATSSGLANSGTFNTTGKTGNVSVASYTQSSTGSLAMNYAPSSNQKLLVTGAASLAGGLTLVGSSGTYQSGRYSLLSAGSVSGTFGTLNTNLSSLTTLGYALAYDSNNVYLVFTPNVADTQQSLVNTAAVLQNTYALQNSVLANSLSYDCTEFGANNVCISVGGRNTAVSAANGLNNTSALLIAAYRPHQNYRIGAYADQNLSVSNPGGTVNLGNNTPLIGLFGAWNQRLDGTGTEIKVSAAYGQKNTTITRSIVGTSEPGTGSSQLNSQGAQVTAKYGFAVTPAVIVSPYLGMRFTQNNMNGYTEATSATVTAPLTYAALNTNATTALAGVGASYRVTPVVTTFASAGVETDTNTSNGTYSATGINGLTPINFNANPVKTRPTATVGAYYDIEKNQRLGITGIYRQEAYQAVSTTTVMATYTVGL